MRFSASAEVSHPAPVVFETIRDHTPDLIHLLPNVDSVEELKREERPPVVHLHCRWQGSKADLPWIVRPFVSKDSLVWFDWADWDEQKLMASWENRARMLSRECVYCAGTTTIAPIGEQRARFEVQGDLRVDPDNVPGLPRRVARKFQNVLEGFIVKALRPNLTSIASAVQRYLDQRPAR